MKHWIAKFILAAVALLLCAAQPSAAETKPGSATEAAGAKGAAAGKSKAAAAKTARKIKLVDINGAGKAELKSLPGIGDAEADKIIAGRPYLSKANLATHNVLARATYEKIKGRVIAKPNKATAAEFSEEKKHQGSR